MGPFMSADKARETCQKSEKQDTVQLFAHFRTMLEHQVRVAVKAKMYQATVEVPERLEQETLTNTKKAFERIGYRVDIRREEGLLAANLIRAPRTYLTLYW